MTEAEIKAVFAETQAIITDNHFVYTSGLHSSAYINKDAVYLHPLAISRLGEEMAVPFNAEQVDVVAAPVLGGIVLSQWVAYHLSTRRQSGDVLAVFAEKGGDAVDKNFYFARGYEKQIPGKRVLIVEDLLTTGGSVRQLIELVRKLGGEVVGLSVLCNRGNVQAEAVGGVPIHSLLNLNLKTYSEEECPFCQQGIPVNTDLGKGKAFLARKAKEQA